MTKLLHDGTEVPIDTPTKIISGRRVLLSAKEILDREKEDAAWQAKKNEKPEPSDIEVRLYALEQKAGVTDDDKKAARRELKKQ